MATGPYHICWLVKKIRTNKYDNSFLLFYVLSNCMSIFTSLKNINSERNFQKQQSVSPLKYSPLYHLWSIHKGVMRTVLNVLLLGKLLIKKHYVVTPDHKCCAKSCTVYIRPWAWSLRMLRGIFRAFASIYEGLLWKPIQLKEAITSCSQKLLLRCLQMFWICIWCCA